MKRGHLLSSNQVVETEVPFSSNPPPCLAVPIQLVDIESQYHDGDLNSFNIVAEIPGTDHSSMDVYERVQPDDAKQASIIMATFVFQAAVRDEKLPRKLLDGDVVTAPATSTPSVSIPQAPAQDAQVPISGNQQ